jgi:hypothetical protein
MSNSWNALDMKKCGTLLFAMSMMGISQIAWSASARLFSSETIGTTAATFLKIPVGPRGTGMGGAYTAVADGADAMWWNPAGMVDKPNREILLESHLLLNELMLNSLAYTEPLGKGDIVGLMINHLSLLTAMPGYNRLGEPIGDIPYSDLAISICYATNAFEVPFGLNFKIISSQLDETSAVGVAGDIGIRQGFFREDLLVGLSLKNFGTKLKYFDEQFPLPFSIHLGAAYRLLHRDLTLAADIQGSFDEPLHYHFGVELVRSLGLTMQFHFRLGYHTQWNEYKNAMNGLNAGLGWKWRIHKEVLARRGQMVGYRKILLFAIGIDYAWIPNDQLENSHRIGLKIYL